MFALLEYKQMQTYCACLPCKDIHLVADSYKSKKGLAYFKRV